jgi:endonuclease/exonuclease/phosphatase family metal-dependent hydrolase
LSVCFGCGPVDDDEGDATALADGEELVDPDEDLDIAALDELDDPAAFDDDGDGVDDDGVDGVDGVDDVDGADAADGADGADVEDGADGEDSEDGADVEGGADGAAAPAEDDRAPAGVVEASADDLTAFADGDVRTKRFRVLHWNIAGGKENNCATTGIRRAVMRYVREANGPVDFVSLNEVCAAQFVAIKRALRRHWGKSDGARFAAFVPSDDSRVGNAIFSRRNLKRVTRQQIGEDQYGKRYLLCGKQANRRVRVCTTHLTPADGAARQQLDRVLERLERWWLERRDTVIIAGDLNIHPNDQALNAMYAPGASTTNNPNNRGRYRELDDDDGEHCRGYGERTVPSFGGGPCGEGGKIDFIFTRANRIVDGQYGADALDIPNTCTGACSDHRAIRGWAQVRYRVD